MHFLKRRKNNQTPRTHSTSGSNAQPSQPGIKSDTLDPSLAQGEAEFSVNDIDPTDRAVHKLVNEILDQVVADVGGSNHMEEARNETNITNTSVGVTKVDRDKIKYQEESQAKMDTINQSPPNQQETLLQQSQSQPNQEPGRTGVEAFRTPPFVWSYLHQILLDSVLRSIEDEFHAVATTSSPKDVALAKEKLETEFLSSDSADGDEYDVAESIAVAHLQAFINDPANQIYAINLIHLISQLSDGLVTACGGLLPLLAATTSPTVVLETNFYGKKFSYLKSKSAPSHYPARVNLVLVDSSYIFMAVTFFPMELEIQEPSSGLLPETAFGFLLRVANIADVVVFMPAASINLSCLEKETGMNAGGIVRQCLRLACLCAVRNCLESRLRDFLPTPEILSQIHTLPAPHHHFIYPLSLLPDNETEPHLQVTPNAPSNSTPTADLADSSLSFTDEQQSKSRFLWGFDFYNLLRNKVDIIQRLASPAASNVGHSTEHLSPDCIAYLDRIGHLSGTLQRLVLGLRPSMVNYPSGYMLVFCNSLPLFTILNLPGWSSTFLDFRLNKIDNKALLHCSIFSCSIYNPNGTWFAVLERWFQPEKMEEQVQMNVVLLALPSGGFDKFYNPLLSSTTNIYQSHKERILKLPAISENSQRNFGGRETAMAP
ncbi:hypothetical protein ACTXT7_017055 [Hymenolepis weldensis]